MWYIMCTMKNRILVSLLALSIAVCVLSPAFSQEATHVEEMFSIRNDFVSQGNGMPDHIKKARGTNLSTLERLFDLNTSALTMIEAYFRIFKIALATESEDDPETVQILNEWLNFIRTQCRYDVEYFDAAMKETTDIAVMDQVNIAKLNSEKLAEIALKGVRENKSRLRK